MMRALPVALLVLAGLFGAAPAYAADCSLGWKLQNQQTSADSVHNVIDFTSISATDGTGCTYNDLRVTGQARGTTTTCDPYVQLTLGSGGSLDTSAHYDWVYTLDYGTGYNEVDVYHDVVMQLGQVPCSTRPNGAASTLVITIPNAFRSTFDKDVLAHFSKGYNQNNSSSYGVANEMSGGVWNTENVIDTMRLKISLGNFQQNSTFTLWAR